MLENSLHKSPTRKWVVVAALARVTALMSAWDIGSVISSAKAQTTSSDPELLRAALRDVLEAQQGAAVMIGNVDAQEVIARSLAQVEQLTWEDLLIFEGLEPRFSDLQTKQEALNEQIMVLHERIPLLWGTAQQGSQYPSEFWQYRGLTNAGYGAICSSNPFGSPAGGPNRSDPDTNQGLVTAITVSDTALVVAEGVRDVAGVVCNTVVVAAGFGGNPQNLACTVSEGIYIAAKGINEALNISFRLLTFCDATIDGAEIEGAFERASDIYDQNVDIDFDLAAHDANIDTDLAGHDTTIKANLATHDANIDADLAAHDANIDADLAAHDADLKAALALHDADVKALLADLQGAVDENQRLIKISSARQLEIMRLLITQEGRREINSVVLTCTGDDCPVDPADVIVCSNGNLDWPCLTNRK